MHTCQKMTQKLRRCKYLPQPQIYIIQTKHNRNGHHKYTSMISEIYIFLSLWNICGMFIFYRYSSLPFAVITLMHAAYCKLYKQVFGCSCKIINSFWTFALLQKYHEELEMKRKRKCRVKKGLKFTK